MRPDAHLVHASVDEAHDSVSDLRYEVMYFLEATDEAIPAFKDVWAGIGDSIVVVGGDGIWNCHIHTDDIGAAIEAAVDCGRPRQIRVTDLHGAGRGGALGPRGGRRRHRRGAAARHRAGHHRGRRRRRRRRHQAHLLQPRRAGHRGRRPVDEPVDRRPAGRGRGGAGRAGRDPAEQQEHHPGGRAGRRPHRPHGARRGHPGHRRGLRRPHGLRPRGAGRRQRQGDDGAVGQRAGRRGHAGGARLDERRRADPARATTSASPATASRRSSRPWPRPPPGCSSCWSPTTTRS